MTATARTALVWVIGLHLLGVAGLFGPGLLFRDAAAVDSDLGLHFYRAAFLRETGAFPGLAWDPAYLGGYVAGGMLSVDNRLGELGVWLLRFLPPGLAWNWTLAVLFGLAPVFGYLAARWSGAERGPAVLAAGLGVLVFWSMRRLGQPHLSNGLYGWVVASTLLPLQFGGLHRVLRAPGPRSAVAFGLATALGGLAHGLSAIYLPSLALVLLARWRMVRARQLLALAGAALLAAAVIAPFTLSVLQTLGEMQDTGLGTYFQASPVGVVEKLSDPDRAYGHALLLLAGVGLLGGALRREAAELAVVAWGVTAFALLAFLVPGGNQAQPTRNLEPALFLAALPAAEVLRQVGPALWQRLERRHRQVVGALALVVAAPAAFGWLITATGQRPLRSGPAGEVRAVVEHLNAHAAPDARVMFEDGITGEHAGVAGYLARELGRPLIGGPHPVTFGPTGQTTFGWGRLLDQRIEKYADAEVREVLADYNVGTVVTWSDKMRRRFTKLFGEGVVLGPYVVFQTGLAGGYAVGARAAAGPNEIRVTGATRPTTRLRWHFDARMRTDPSLPLREVPAPHSPVGFIEVDNGAVTDFAVRFVPP